jgi:hypothetical protein
VDREISIVQPTVQTTRSASRDRPLQLRRPRGVKPHPNLSSRPLRLTSYEGVPTLTAAPRKATKNVLEASYGSIVSARDMLEARREAARQRTRVRGAGEANRSVLRKQPDRELCVGTGTA